MTRIKYIDMDACPSVAFSMMLVVGIFCMGIPFGVWWLGCLLFEWLGWESFCSVFHVVGFAVALFFALGLTYGAKTTATAASYGAFFLDAAVAALVCMLVWREVWTLWTFTALAGLAIHLAGKIPAVARLRAERDRKDEEKELEKTAAMLVEQGADPVEVERAVEEVRAEKAPGTQVAWFELLRKFDGQNRSAEPREDASSKD